MKKTKAELLAIRKKHLGKNLSLSYDEPLKIVKGEGQFLFDEEGRAYLDCVNNVCHVGHAQPQVVKAGQEQMAILNTNTRYLHDNIVELSEKLLSKFPEELSVCYFVNSGSEANELALRMAKAYTGQKDIVVIDNAYHGNTQACIDISPYKFNGKGGQGQAEHVHVLRMPDSYRDERYELVETELELGRILDGLEQKQRKPAALIAEAILGCGGQMELPKGFLNTAYRMVRERGGVAMADEVQTGFGRVGDDFWAYQAHDVIPDIVTMGKPMGNGHPVAAVVCKKEIAEAFDNGMEYFNTFGGNPVSSAIGIAVLDVIEKENLQRNAKIVGEYFIKQLDALQEKYEIIGDIRGRGLFLGIELVKNKKTKEPATEQAKEIINKMKERGVLLSTDGPYNNVIKIKPPIVFDEDNVRMVIENLTAVLDELSSD